MQKCRFFFGFSPWPTVLMWLFTAALSHAQDIQWADEVLDFSSEYREEKYTKEFRAIQVLGRPNKLPQFGSSFCAWSPASRGDTLGEWIKVGYKIPMRIRQIAIAESLNEGTVEKIFLFDEHDRSYKVYENRRIDTVAAVGRMLNVFIPFTPYKVKAVKLILNVARIKGWNHIDAIGISASDVPVKAEINVSASIPAELKKENLGPAINTKAEEISPAISPDGNTLYFTRSPHPENIGRPDAQDVWYSVWQPDTIGGSRTIRGGSWSRAVNIGPPINNSDQNSSFSITPDGNTMLLNNVYLPNGRMKRGLSITKKTANGWEFPKEVKIANYYNDSEYSEFTLAQNGLVLIMTVQRKDTYGRKDLYVSFLKSDNSWTEPRNMGQVVNSAEDETSPFIASDGVSLYYSTAGFSGYGNNDMFVTKRLDDTWLNWSEPQNLGPNLNTPDWDAYFSIPASGEYAYFVSANNSIGEGDIFRVRLSPEVQPEPVVLVRGNVYNAATHKPLSSDLIYNTLRRSGTPDAAGKASVGHSHSTAGKQAGSPTGRRSKPSSAVYPPEETVSELTEQPAAAQSSTTQLSVSGRATSNPSTGAYQLVLPVKQEYNLMASAAGFISVNETIDLTQYSQYQEIQKDLYLTPLEVGQKIALTSIPLNKANITYCLLRCPNWTALRRC